MASGQNLRRRVAVGLSNQNPNPKIKPLASASAIIVIIMLAFGVPSAGYLQNAAHFSQTLTTFLDLLFDKINFLAELVIEAANEDDCLPACASSSSISTTTTNTNSEQHTHKQALKAGDEYTYHADIAVRTDKRRRLAQDFDGCRIFNLNVESRDLPAPEMQVCCSQAHSCYATCGSQKRACDSDFQQCLANTCELLKSPASRTRRSAAAAAAADDNEPTVDPSEVDEEESGGMPSSEEFDEADLDKSSGNEDDGSDDSKKKRRKRSQDNNTTDIKAEQETRQVDADARGRFKACRLAAKVLVIGNLAFGCQQFRRAQVNCTSYVA